MNEDERTFGNYRELKALLEAMTEQELDQRVRFVDTTFSGDRETYPLSEITVDEKGLRLT